MNGVRGKILIIVRIKDILMEIDLNLNFFIRVFWVYDFV